MLKLSIFLHFLQYRVTWSHFTKNIYIIYFRSVHTKMQNQVEFSLVLRLSKSKIERPCNHDFVEGKFRPNRVNKN